MNAGDRVTLNLPQGCDHGRHVDGALGLLIAPGTAWVEAEHPDAVGEVKAARGEVALGEAPRRWPGLVPNGARPGDPVGVVGRRRQIGAGVTY